MTFIWNTDGPGIAIIVTWCIVLLITVCVARFDASWRNGAAVFGVLAVIVWAATALGSNMTGGNTEDPATTTEVASMLGLQPDHSYPLVLGNRVSGSSGRVVDGGFFTATVVSLQPASAITVSFTSGSSSYILELPSSKITFHQSGGPEHVQLHLVDNLSDNSHWTTTFSGCRWVIHNLAPGCLVHTTSHMLSLDPTTRRQGLAPLVAQSLDTASITLTPEHYQQLVGSPAAPSTMQTPSGP